MEAVLSHKCPRLHWGGAGQGGVGSTQEPRGRALPWSSSPRGWGPGCWATAGGLLWPSQPHLAAQPSLTGHSLVFKKPSVSTLRALSVTTDRQGFKSPRTHSWNPQSSPCPCHHPQGWARTLLEGGSGRDKEVGYWRMCRSSPGRRLRHSKVDVSKCLVSLETVK